ncbi:hypothetical protein DM01DRAFT_1330780 [Hesseltinella vesiculosa]|uniref:Uncharacterized protein n=1 Tax=Hesseltinella vesiculosa TaxID=101127 RepID=A0A1X2GYD4_9FUNG|nr:hypothetical protein DM01DRAFT_1330780 [Hesseltinella vesiculosa]
MPVITCLLDHPSTTYMVTQSSWTHQLVRHGVISHLHDNVTMQALSELHLLFHTQQQQPTHRTMHRIYSHAQAYFPVNHIYRPTVKLQKALDAALAFYPHDPVQAWHALCAIWHDFGFLWPQKIVLGHSYHAQHGYQVGHPQERLQQLHSAREVATRELNKQLESAGLPPLDSSSGTAVTTPDVMEIVDHCQEAKTWKVIKRTDVRPMYEFLPEATRQLVEKLIRQFVHRIPLNQSFLLESVLTKGYLCWRPQQRQPSSFLHFRPSPKQHSPAANLHHQGLPTMFPLPPSSTSSFGMPRTPFSIGTLPLPQLAAVPGSCLWQFTLKPSVTSPSLEDTHDGDDSYVKCGNQLFLSPCVHVDGFPPLPGDHQLPGQPILTQAATFSPQPPSNMLSELLERGSRLQSVELIDAALQSQPSPSRTPKTAVTSPLSSSSQGSTNASPTHRHDHTWTIETPHLGLDHDNDMTTDQSLNADIAIGRRKPILHGDIISLRQILYLCAVMNAQTARPPAPAFLGIPSPIPPAAEAIMANLERQYAHHSPDPSSRPQDNDATSVAFGHPSLAKDMTAGPREVAQKTQKKSDLDLASLRSVKSTASQASLPFYNLQTYTVVDPFVTKSSQSANTTPNLSSPSMPSSQSSSSFGHRHVSPNTALAAQPVCAKEVSLLSNNGDSYWIIRLLSEFEGSHIFTQAHTRQQTVDDAILRPQHPAPTVTSHLRRAQSYSSVHDHHQQKRRQQQHIDGSPRYTRPKKPPSPSPIGNIDPYLAYYAHHSQYKTIKNVLKKSTLTHLTKWIKPQKKSPS